MQVSPFCLGTMMFGAWGNPDHAESVRTIQAALDAGINFVDTADVYSRGESEQIVGKAIKGRRDSVVLATKVHGAMGDDPNEKGNSRRWIAREVESSLKRLDTDWIDLYQIHRPDPTTDIEETLSALTDLVHEGKVRAIGCSTFPAELIVESHWAAERRSLERFRCEQPQYSIFVRDIERAVLPVCERYAMGAIVWGPLAAGWLTGRYRHSTEIDLSTGRAGRMPHRFDPALPGNQAKLDAIEKLLVLAESTGVSLTHLAMAFTLSHPGVTSAIIGPRTLEQLEDLIKGAAIELGDEVLDAIDAIVPPGKNLNDGDSGWIPPSIAEATLRRRPPGQRSAS